MAYFLLLAINILFLFLVTSGNKYWLLSIPLWVMLIPAFVVWRSHSDKNIQALQSAYWKTAQTRGYGGDQHKLASYKNAQLLAANRNVTFLYCICLQTLITFILQLLGESRTDKKIYSTTKWLFGILFAFAVLLLAMMGIVPTSGMIG